MSFKASIPLRNAMLDLMATDLDLGLIYIFGYTGAATSEPTLPTDTIGSSVNLVTISVDGLGGGLSFGAASNGLITKDSDTWKGTVGTTGTALFYRMGESGDNCEAADLTAKRLQGSVDILNADLLLASTTLTAGNVQNINYFAIGLPSN